MSYRSVYEDESGYPMYIEVKFEDGKDVKYNLATKETIGKSGKIVKNIIKLLYNVKD